MAVPFTRAQQITSIRGVNLRLPTDKLPEDQWPILENVRSYLLGTFEGRPGLTALTAALATSPMHSIMRLNDDTPSAGQPYTYIVGSGARVFAGAPPAGAAISTGFSGNPLSLVSYRPDQAVSPWCYIADSSKMAKANVSGTVQSWGIEPPLLPPTAALGVPTIQVVEDFNAVGAWTAFGGGAAPGTSNRIVATVIASILYDTGNTGWCCVEPTAFADTFQAGMLLTVGGTTEVCRVQLIRRKIPSTTIGSIIYDSGSTGLCSIQPVNLITDIGVTLEQDLVDSLIRIKAAEDVRILSVTISPEGNYSLRCSTAGTFAAGDAIAGKDSVRIYTVNNHTTADSVSAVAVSTVITAPATSPFQAGVHVTGLTKNLLQATNPVTGATRPLHPSDELHLSIQVTNLTKVQEGRILFDVDKTTTDFSKNYFFWAFRQPDIASALQETFTAATAPTTISSVLPTVVTRRQYDASGNLIGRGTPTQDSVTQPVDATDPGNVPVSQQTGFGELQWIELRFKFSDLTRVGTDLSRTMANVGGIQIQLTLTGGTTMLVDGLWVGGGYGADVGAIGAPYIYKFRGRSSVTGARSLYSPPMRSGVQPRRDSVAVTLNQHPNTAADLLDVARFGGNLTKWRLVGTVANGASPGFVDEFDDVVVEGNEPEDATAYQPFPTVDSPKTGTVNVAGTTVTRASGDLFKTSWAPGTVITIGGVNYTLYAQPSTTSKLQIVQNGGTQAGAAYVIPEATILGQPMPCVWGDFQGYFFGVGDDTQPGVLFWTNRFTPDTADERNQLEVTDPSDQLMNGAMLSGWPFVWSQTNIYRITPDYTSPNVFLSQMAVPGAGLYARWFICEVPGFGVAYGDKDGIYLYDGSGAPRSITDEALYPIFPHDGVVGVATNGFYPPDYAQTAFLRLSCAYGQIFFDYKDTQGEYRTLMYDTASNSWWPDVYFTGLLTHYGESGTTAKKLLAGGFDGVLYECAGVSDFGHAIAGHARSRSDNAGDVRLDKLFGDAMLDVDQRGSVLTTQIGFNKFSTVEAPVINAAASGEQQLILGIANGDGVTARDVALDMSWSSVLGGPRVFAWGWSLVPKVEQTTLRVTDWDDAGTRGAKYVQGILLRADTLGVSKVINIESDGNGNVGASITVNDNGERLVPYAFAVPIPAAHLLRLVPVPSGAVPWRMYEYQWIFEPAPEPGIVWSPQGTTFDLDGFKHLFLAGISYVATTDCILSLVVDGVTRSLTYTLPTTAGLHLKRYVQIEPVKGKLFQPILTAAQPCQVFARDCEFWVGPWASNAPYSIQKPFGGPSRATGAQI